MPSVQERTTTTITGNSHQHVESGGKDHGGDTTNILLRTFNAFCTLFFTMHKFQPHRLFGLAYLIQFVWISYLYVSDYNRFLNSPFIITLPVCGCVQAIIAVYTFTFLPKKQKAGGYFSYRPGNKQGSLSYQFIKENVFFSGLLMFQFTYYNPKVTPFYRWLWPLEYCFVFLPYVFRRLLPNLFPKTSFRDDLASMRDLPGQKFYYWITWFTKFFYIWAKHYLGLFLNYLRFVNGANDYDVQCVFLIEITSAFATTIAIFLHTLRFRGYLDPKVSLFTYVVGYMCTFIGYIMIAHVFWLHSGLFFVVLAGLVLNIVNVQWFHYYQIVVMCGFHYVYRLSAYD